MFESFFIFDGKFYEQCDGVTMDFPLGPTLANVFMCYFENIWLENSPAHFKPIVYKRFVYDKSLLFLSFIPEMYKRGLTETLFHRSFRLCSSYENFHREIETLKSVNIQAQ